uniref:DUF4220 domain-containing protein n=2 Tax=Aegilops tauschii subsp. strangulata TaxID=200361 RepID=A0A453JFP1_AEGTS
SYLEMTGGNDYTISSYFTCNATLHPYVHNLTSSYTDQKNEAFTVTTSIVMFILAALFFNLNLFSRLSNVSAILNPTVRLFLSTSLSLFLPVMSYLFSEAKKDNATTMTGTGTGSSQLGAELSLRARTILMWMLLVELLRKKVEAILVNVGMQWYSGTIDRAARIVWLGYLVFYNVKSTGKRVIYGTLWVLAAAKLLQRVAINELLKRSFAYGRNAQLLNSYMTQMLHEEERRQLLQQQQQRDEVGGSELLKMCRYPVIGEDNLERKAGPDGYHLQLPRKNTTDDAADSDSTTDDSHADADSATVTVGDIWSLPDDKKDKGGLLLEDPRLKRLCLSFALYKLLRRRFEDLPITGAETHNCRNLIFKGLHKELLLQGVKATKPQGLDVELQGADVAAALFQVFDEEVQFLCEYYHSFLPVVLSNPFFFLANYILFPILVWAFCILTFILCGNGNVHYALQSIKSDNYIISTGAMTLTRCLLRRIGHSPEVLFATIDLSITILLLLTFLYEQVWEYLVFILSNWLMVSLLCHYTGKRQWRQSRGLTRLIHCLLWVRSKLSHRNLCFKQYSVLCFCPLLPNKAVPKEVKKSILDYLVTHIDGHGDGGHAAPLTNGWSILQSDKHSQYRTLLASACENKSGAEVILICHIATSLLEVRYPMQNKTLMGSHRKVATTLSKYCAYLVAQYPELLPEDKDGTELTYKEMVEDLKKELGGCWRYHLSRQSTRYKKLREIGRPKHATVVVEPPPMTTVQTGAKLGRKLIHGANEHDARVWELLADFWTELMVYVAPSSSEVHVKAHKEALAQGGEFVTVLWALTTHTGITRPAVKPWTVIPIQDVEDTTSPQSV